MSLEDKTAVSSDQLKRLAAQKEKEWRDIQELRAKSLEAALRESEKSLDEYKAKFNKLKDDFKYNLKLLNGRDAELSNYDSQSVAAKREVSVKEAEMSELKIQLDEAHRAVTREVKAREDMQQHYQHRVREKQAQIDQYKASKDAEVNKERFDLENTKRELERKLVQAEEELDAQRRDLTSGFEEEMRKREHGYRKQSDETNANMLAHDMKVKILSKELELMKTAQSTVEQGYEERDSAVQQMDKQLKQREWQLQDYKAIHDAKTRELELKLELAEHTAKRAQEDYTRKHAELSRYMNEKEAALTNLKSSAAERERQLNDTVRHVTSQLETMETQYRQLEWNKQDLEREKDSHNEKLEEELNDVKSRLESRASDVLRENTSMELELMKLRENETKFKTDLVQRKQDIERYRKEIEQALEREASLERSKAQVDLDWQRRYENIERQQYEKSEDLVRHLTQARDEAQALLKEKVREIKHQSDIMTVLTEDRDRALATLKHYGLVTKKDIDLSQFNDLPVSAAKQLEELQQQNDNLRHVVHQMRAEMECLGSEVKRGENGPAVKKVKENEMKHSVASEYVQNLEKEIMNLKKKCRVLEQQSNTALNAPVRDDVTRAVGDNMVIQSHMQRLNSEIGTLRSEKVEVMAQSRKQQARIQYLDTHMEQLSKEPREKQVELEQLQYEMSAESRRTHAQVTSLNHRIRDLELQIIETRKEADEYMKANIEANNRVTALQQELSSLKVNIAQATPTVNFGAQEMLIQQLQDEIEHLRNQLKCHGQGHTIDTAHIPVPTKGQEVKVIKELHSKLRQAAKQITHLAKEKQQLIEMGNRLRADLNKYKIGVPRGPPKQAFVYTGVPTNQNASSPIHTNIASKLSQLEQLQYALTKQELTYNQKFGSKTEQYIPAINVDSSQELDGGESTEYQPKSILKKSIEFMDKLSPVPEHDVHIPRSKSSSPNKFANAQTSARSDRPYSARTDVTSQRASSPIKDQHALRISMSSVGGESLQDIWNMLDREGTPRTPYDSQEGPFAGLSFPGDAQKTMRPHTAPKLTVTGTKNPLKPKPSQEPKKLTPRTGGKGHIKKAQNKQNIRNWNDKDDTKVK